MSPEADNVRILHVHPGNMFGGAERVMCNIARRSGSGITHEFALFPGLLADRIRDVARVHDLPTARFRNPLSIWQARRALLRILEENEYAGLLSHAVWTQAVFGSAMIRSGVPTIFWLRGRIGGKDWIERLARPHVPNGAICNSEFTANTLDALYHGIPRTVIYNPLYPTPPKRTRSEVRRDFGLSDGDVVIILVSRIEPGKGHQLLLDALPRLGSNRIKVWIVGGPQRTSEENLFESLKRGADEIGWGDRVRFFGLRDDVWDLYHAADIFCQPNLLPEGFGNTFVEAMYAGLPVVTTAMGGALEIVDDSCGFLIDAGNVDQIASTLTRLADEVGLRKKLGAAGPMRARSLCDPDQQFDKLYHGLRKLLDSQD